MKRAALLLRCSTNIQDYNRQKLELEKVANRFKLKVAKVFGEHVTGKDDKLLLCNEQMDGGFFVKAVWGYFGERLFLGVE